MDELAIVIIFSNRPVVSSELAQILSWFLQSINKNKTWEMEQLLETKPK